MIPSCSSQVSVIPSMGHAQNSNGVFELEREDAREGSVCKWNEHFRIRHVSTGRLLACFAHAPPARSRPVSMQRSRPGSQQETRSIEMSSSPSPSGAPIQGFMDGADTEGDIHETMTVVCSK